MRLIFGGKLLVPKPHLSDLFQALLEEYRRETARAARESFGRDSEDLVKRRVEGLMRLTEIGRKYEPRFRAVTICVAPRRNHSRRRGRKKPQSRRDRTQDL